MQCLLDQRQGAASKGRSSAEQQDGWLDAAHRHVHSASNAVLVTCLTSPPAAAMTVFVRSLRSCHVVAYGSPCTTICADSRELCQREFA